LQERIRSLPEGATPRTLAFGPARLFSGARLGESGNLVLAGHRFEAGSPYEWTSQMRATIGGKVFTVEDDVHGSVLREPGCAAELVSYFTTGRTDGGCAGIPTP